MATDKTLIAVVDDDRSVVKSLARMLRSTGYEVSTFGSAQEFLDSLAHSIPRCLILDVHMPQMTGLELQTRLQELGHQVQIVFITAQDTPQTRAATELTGTVALLFKPFGNAALLEAIREGVRRSAPETAGGGGPNPTRAEPQFSSPGASSHGGGC